MEKISVDSKGHWLDRPAAQSFQRCVADGAPNAITVAGRTYAEQKVLRDKYLKGTGNFALAPGTSQHERGNAIDAKDALIKWLEINGAAYGWRRTNRNERWHWEYFPDRDTHKNRVSAPAVTPKPIEDIDMPAVVQRVGRTEIYFLDGGNLVWLKNATQVNECLALSKQSKAIWISETTFAEINAGVHQRAQLAADKVLAGLKKAGVIK